MDESIVVFCSVLHKNKVPVQHRFYLQLFVNRRLAVLHWLPAHIQFRVLILVL